VLAGKLGASSMKMSTSIYRQATHLWSLRFYIVLVGMYVCSGLAAIFVAAISLLPFGQVSAILSQPIVTLLYCLLALGVGMLLIGCVMVAYRVFRIVAKRESRTA
jgi:hypothetical protein